MNSSVYGGGRRCLGGHRKLRAKNLLGIEWPCTAFHSTMPRGSGEATIRQFCAVLFTFRGVWSVFRRTTAPAGTGGCDELAVVPSSPEGSAALVRVSLIGACGGERTPPGPATAGHESGRPPPMVAGAARIPGSMNAAVRSAARSRGEAPTRRVVGYSTYSTGSGRLAAQAPHGQLSVRPGAGRARQTTAKPPPPGTGGRLHRRPPSQASAWRASPARGVHPHLTSPGRARPRHIRHRPAVVGRAALRLVTPSSR
jgi:hypothetical protein